MQDGADPSRAEQGAEGIALDQADGREAGGVVEKFRKLHGRKDLFVLEPSIGRPAGPVRVVVGCAGSRRLEGGGSGGSGTQRVGPFGRNFKARRRMEPGGVGCRIGSSWSAMPP